MHHLISLWGVPCTSVAIMVLLILVGKFYVERYFEYAIVMSGWF